MHSTEAPVARGPVLAAVLAAASALCVLWLVAGPLGSLIRVDAVVLDDVVRERPGWLATVAVVLSTVGMPTVAIGLAVLVGGWLSWRHRVLDPIVLGASGLCALALGDVGLKDLVGRARPPRSLWAMPAHGASFPSGHALFALGAFLLITVMVVRTRAARPSPSRVALGAGSALAIGLSRVVVGVHYPSDVLAGWAVAVIAVGVVVLVLGPRSHGTHISRFVPSRACAFWSSRTRSRWPDC